MLSIKNLFTVICICCTTIVVAQIDTNKENKNSKIKFNAKVNTATKPEALNPTNTNGFETAYNKEQKKVQQKINEEKLKNQGILNSAKRQEEAITRKFRTLNNQFLFPRVDQDLGSIQSNSKSIHIICRDFQYPDGDRVTILINDRPYILDITLQENYQKFSVPISIGVNKLAFKALNQGTSGPNTAGFKVYDERGSVLSSGEWNLATGAKATLLIIKDK